MIQKVNPERLVALTEEEVILELVPGLTVTCHKDGCFHFAWEDYDERMHLITKAVLVLLEAFDLGKESEDVEVMLYAVDYKIPQRKIAKQISKGVSTELKTRVESLHHKNVGIGGIRFICPPDLSCILDVSGVSTRMGPRKTTLDKLRHEDYVQKLIEETTHGIEKFLEI
jgi:hypothetical protein